MTRFFLQSLPKYCSNFNKLRKMLPNIGFQNNYVIMMPKYNSYAIKVEKICPRLPIALFPRPGSSVHHFEHIIKQETHIFTMQNDY